VASDRSFTNYIKTRFYDPIYTAASDFVNGHLKMHIFGHEKCTGS
jgi:hypothetical protein